MKKDYRYCKYCDRIVPFGYDIKEHKKICKVLWQKSKIELEATEQPLF